MSKNKKKKMKKKAKKQQQLLQMQIEQIEETEREGKNLMDVSSISPPNVYLMFAVASRSACDVATHACVKL